MRPLIGACAGAVVALLYSIAIGTPNLTFFSAVHLSAAATPTHIARNVLILTLGGMFVGLVLSVLFEWGSR